MNASEKRKTSPRSLLLAALAAVYALAVGIRAGVALSRPPPPGRPVTHRSARDLSPNHRLLESDLTLIPGAVSPSPEGRYVQSALRKGAQIHEGDLARRPDLRVRSNEALFPLSLKDRGYLTRALDAGDCVTVCDAAGSCVGTFEVKAISCDAAAPPACAALLVVPQGLLPILAATKPEIFVTVTSSR